MAESKYSTFTTVRAHFVVPTMMQVGLDVMMWQNRNIVLLQQCAGDDWGNVFIVHSSIGDDWGNLFIVQSSTGDDWGILFIVQNSIGKN